jgi:CubicO group peptidase (beta-lactamase class C family)
MRAIETIMKRKSSGFLFLFIMCASLAGSCSIPTADTKIQYQTYESGSLGIQTVIPSTWIPFWPEGVFVRDMPTTDPTFLIFGSILGVTKEQFLGSAAALAGLDENLNSTGNISTDSLFWDLISFPIQQGFLLVYYPDYGTLQFDCAFAEINGALVYIAMGSPPDQRDSLYEEVFLPAVNSYSFLPDDYSSNYPPIVDPPERDYWPTEDWHVAMPEKRDLDGDKLQDMVVYIRENEIPLKEVLVIKDGYIVLEESFRNFQSTDNVASVTKSFTSALIGIAIDQGIIENVEQPVIPLFPDRDIKNADAYKRSLTVEDLLTMRAGLEWPAGPCPWLDGRECADYTTQIMLEDENSLQFTLDQPMDKEPGTVFQYNSGASHLLAGIIQESTGETPLEFAKEYLFTPLGIEYMGWATDGEGLNIGRSEIKMQPRDMAKFGYLFLNQGIWEGEQIISSGWVLESQKPHAVAASQGIQPYYGYQWWVNPELGFYNAAGAGGNYIIVVPEYDMVVVFTGELNGVSGQEDWWEGTPEELFRVYILPTVQ